MSDPLVAVEVLSRTAVLLERQHRLPEALAQWRLAQRHHPDNVDVSNGLGRVLAQRGEPAEALALFERVLAREPRNAEALFNRGNALRLLVRREEAIEAYRAVLPLHADYARLALVEIARQQQALQDFAGARISYLQLYHVSGGSLESIGYRLSNEHHFWPPDPAGMAALARDLGARYAAQAAQALTPLPAARVSGERLRIGVVSADLWSHPVGYFLESLLGSTAARAADWVVYSHRQPQPDALTARLRRHAQMWHDIVQWPDEQLARQIREDGIDVLVDLSGYSAHHRLAAFAARPAPLQLSWLGYHGTTGLPFMDAVIADPVCVRAGEEHFFTEPLLRLPHTRLCYTPQPDAPPISAAPALRHKVVTFGCVQRAAKIGPQVLAAWACIANALPQARWVLSLGDLSSGASDMERLRRRCAAAGFAPAYLDIRETRSIREYLSGYADVDLMLDTFPYPGGTTTAEALWQGVPTLTLSVPGMLGRQGEQMMTAANLPEWVTHSVDEYVAKAIDAGRAAAQARFTDLRAGLREHLRHTPLFDSERFGRDWMALVLTQWRKCLAQPRTAWPRRVVFLVPAAQGPTGGIKVICEHVALLRASGVNAWVHGQSASASSAFWDVQVPELADWQPAADDLVVVPEVMSGAAIVGLRRHGCRVLVLMQNWIRAHECLSGWPADGVAPFDGVIAVSRLTQQFALRYLTQLPCWVVPPAITQITGDKGLAVESIAIMPRKRRADAVFLRSMWPIAFPDLADVPWIEIDGVNHAGAMAQLRGARYFVSLQDREGLGLPALEAMAAGCLVLGFTGLGGDEYASADNGVWIHSDRVPTLLEALGTAIRAERQQPAVHDAMRQAAQATAARYAPEVQAQRVSEVYAEVMTCLGR